MTEERCSILLTGKWSTSPEYWRNFIRSFNFNDDASEDHRIMEISNGLLKYNAYHAVKNLKQYSFTSTIVFKTLADKTLFILKWS